MTARVLLDTNIVIAAIRREPLLKERIFLASSVFVPSIVVGELLYGAHNAQHSDKEFAKIDRFLTNLDELAILPCDHATAQVFGWLKHTLTSVGRPIPENDYWIASLAYRYDLTLITRVGHFQGIGDIVVERW